MSTKKIIEYPACTNFIYLIKKIKRVQKARLAQNEIVVQLMYNQIIKGSFNKETSNSANLVVEPF